MRAALILLFLTVSACVPSEPIVTAYNGDSVTISQVNLAGEGNRSAVSDAAGTTICVDGGKREAVYASSRYEGGMLHHLYLCR
jgi:hypothetical protein